MVYLSNNLLAKLTFREENVRLYTHTCIESALMISPPYFFANSRESFVFPVPVEPSITTNGTFFSILFTKIHETLQKNTWKTRINWKNFDNTAMKQIKLAVRLTAFKLRGNFSRLKPLRSSIPFHTENFDENRTNWSILLLLDKLIEKKHYWENEYKQF